MSKQDVPHEQNEKRAFAETEAYTAKSQDIRLTDNELEKTQEFKIKNADPSSVHKFAGQAESSGLQEEINSQKNQVSSKHLPKGVIIAIIAAAVTVVAILIAVVFAIVLKKDNVENNSIIVYRKGDGCIIRIYDKEVSVDYAGADNFKADKESKTVCFTVPSSQDEDYFDLYYVQLAKGRISGPTLIDNAVENNYETNDNKVYYLKYNNEIFAHDGCICDISSKKITTFSSNVNGIYYLNADCVYFTKPDGENLALYSYSDEAVQEVSRNVTELRVFSESEKPHIVYQTNSGEYQSASSLYVAYEGKTPELICDAVNKVALDEYEPGGNLYYFTSSQESISWSYVISDELSESDKSIEKPDEWDFLWDFLGVSSGYGEAMAAYAEKTARDEIRAALDDLTANGGMVAPVYTVFAYNGKKTLKIADGVDPSRVFSYSCFGDPKIVFEKTTIKQGKTDIATLCEMSKSNDIQEVVAYAKNLVAECVESQGMAVAAADGQSYTLNGYDKNKTLFSFTEKGDILFAVVNDSQGGGCSLYCNTFGKSGITNGETVSANVKSNSVAVNCDSVVYMVAETGKETGDVFSFNAGEKVKISNAANEFVVDDSNNVFVVKNEVADGEKVNGDYFTQFGGNEIAIGKGVLTSSFVSREDGSAAFIEEESGDSRLVIYFNGETVEVCDGATQLLLYK